MPRVPHIYLLPEYGNEVQDIRHATTHTSKKEFRDGSINIVISEINSLTEDRYSFTVEHSRDKLAGELMIHHHPKGHPGRHLQFKLKGLYQTIRIDLEPLDRDDYEKCIKGFMYQLSLVLRHETQHANKDLVAYFFKPTVADLEPFGKQLLQKVRHAFEQGRISDDKGTINADQLSTLQSDSRLLPFLEWEDN